MSSTDIPPSSGHSVIFKLNFRREYPCVNLTLQRKIRDMIDSAKRSNSPTVRVSLHIAVSEFIICVHALLNCLQHAPRVMSTSLVHSK